MLESGRAPQMHGGPTHPFNLQEIIHQPPPCAHHASCPLRLAASAQAIARERDRDRDGDPNCASGPLGNAARTDDDRLKAPLSVVGLTADGQLVCF